MSENKKIRVTVWHEYLHEKSNKTVARIYPEGMHVALANHLKTQEDLEVRTATLEEPEHGLTDEVLDNTDVLTWWGHAGHHLVSDTVVDKVCKRVLDGMGFIALHSGHMSKVFKKLMGTSCDLLWREDGDKERLWVVNPGHPIVEGIGPYIELPQTETYGEFFDIPEPDSLIFISWFEGGEVFRSGCCYQRGSGKIFYFRPGHETYPIYYNPEILRVITNAIRWTAPVAGPARRFGHVKPLETK
jgi:trehalose utilization protein